MKKRPLKIKRDLNAWGLLNQKAGAHGPKKGEKGYKRRPKHPKAIP